jgi:hypothetical protein
MMQTGKRFIGVIKDLGSSWAMSKWTAMSLERGEDSSCVLSKSSINDALEITEVLITGLAALPGQYVG